jgi:hypothetical protein
MTTNQEKREITKTDIYSKAMLYGMMCDEANEWWESLPPAKPQLNWLPVDIKYYKEEVTQGWQSGLRKVLTEDGNFLQEDMEEVLCEFNNDIEDLACEVVGLRYVLKVLLSEIELKQTQLNTLENERG